jgi:hypothetical protein
MRRRTLVASALVVALATSAGLLTFGSPRAGAATPVKSVGVALPVDDFRAIELDEARGRLYVAQGAVAQGAGSGAGLPLVVTDLDGRLLDRVDAVTDISDVELSGDGRTLFAAHGFSQVIALDADTLAITGTYPAPEGVCPYNVQATGGKVVAGYLDCGTGSGGLAIWSAPGTMPLLYTDTANYIPVIDASPGAPGLLVAGDTGYSPVKTYVLDVSGDKPAILGSRPDTGSNLQDYALSPDGSVVVESTGSPYEHRAYHVPDLSDAGVYPSGAYPTDAQWSGDGSTVAIGRGSAMNDPDVYLYDRGATTPRYVVDFHPRQDLWRSTLLVDKAGTRAWAVTTDVDEQTMLLHSFGEAHPPIEPVTDLTITAHVGTGKDKHTAYVTATLTFPNTGLQQVWVTASTDGGAEEEFMRGSMDTTGRLTGTYSLPRGTTTFTVRYNDFDHWYPSATATTTLTR